MKKILPAIAFVFLLPILSHAQGGGYTVGPFNSTGGVYVCSYPASGTPCTNLANIYTTSALSTTIVQPVTLQGSNTITFFAWPGQYVVQSPSNSYSTVINVVGPSGTGVMVYLTGSAYTNATTTFSNVTGLSFPVQASANIHAVCRITWQGSATTTGPKYQFTGPTSPTAVAIGMNSVVTATSTIAASATGFASAVANSGTITATTNFTDTVDVAVLNGTTAGTVQLQAAANGVGTLTIQPGSYCHVM